MTPDFSTQQSEQYRTFLREIIELINQAEVPVEQAAKALGRPREDTLADTREKLRREVFSIVLIGAFQSGKSTLFNYLCDGRELSPVGPGGGGIRTSGCRVSAHPQVEGGREYAEVTWRTKGELLRSLGSSLRVYYDICDRESANVSYLTEGLVNLDDKDHREKLAGHAWEEMHDTTADFSHSSKTELMRFALLVCAFYPDFAERINKRTEEWKVDDAVVISSYPQDWESRWERVKSPEQVREAFSPQEVTFAFCGGLDFHLDSANLRILGCSICDCPGLFISAWDTEIAKTCIREADAVLYMFGGDKALTQSDLEALQACVTLGGKHKLIFGANLKIPSRQWKRVETEAVAPILRANGFEDPEIHALHAGLALRAYEAILHQYGSLSEPSRRAISIELNDLGRETTDENITWYLQKKQLKRFIERLTDDEQELEDFCDENGSIAPTGALDELSAVPRFVRCASDFVTKHKFESILLNQGCQKVSRDLKTMEGYLSAYHKSISGDIEKKKKALTRVRENLKKLKDKKEESCNHVDLRIETGCNEILRYYDKELDKLYDNEAVPRIQETFLSLKPDFFLTAIFRNKRKLALEFEDAFIRICTDCFKALRENINATLPTLPEFQKISQAFDRERRSMTDEFSQLGELSAMAEIEVHLSGVKFEEAINNMLPNEKTIMDALTEGSNDFWGVIWEILTFGVNRLFTNNRKYADAFIAEHDARFRKVYKRALKSALSEKGGPFDIIRTKGAEFKKACEAGLEQCNKQIGIAEDALKMVNTPEAHDKLYHIRESLRQIKKCHEATSLLEERISELIESSHS